MKIAIPVFGSRISPRLDRAKKILLIKIEEKDRKVLSVEEKARRIRKGVHQDRSGIGGGGVRTPAGHGP